MKKPSLEGFLFLEVKKYTSSRRIYYLISYQNHSKLIYRQTLTDGQSDAQYLRLNNGKLDMAVSKLQMQMAAIAVAVGSLGLAFWQCAGLIWDAGGVAGVVTAWALGPVRMTVAAWHAVVQEGNWWPLISLFVGIPLGLVMYFSADSLEGSGF